MRLQRMMNNHSYKIEDAITLVHEDTALSSEMLRYANNTYVSGKTPITTIKNAIVRLGSQQIVNLAFTASMATCKSDNPAINTYFKKLWIHCHTVAITSAWLVVQVKQGGELLDINADEVYLAGLFHEIGKLYLLKSMDNLIKSDLLHIDMDLIYEILGELNIQQGIKVMQYWNIPEIYLKTLELLDADNWKCSKNDYMVAALRLSCKLHDYIEQGIDVTETSQEFNLVKDELIQLDVDDVAYVTDFIKAIL